jgi:hypothetical protein
MDSLLQRSSCITRSIVAPAAGGAVGGLVIIVLLIFAWLSYRKRRRTQNTLNIPPFNPTTLYDEQPQWSSDLKPSHQYLASPPHHRISDSEASVAPMMSSPSPDIIASSASWTSGSTRRLTDSLSLSTPLSLPPGARLPDATSSSTFSTSPPFGPSMISTSPANVAIHRPPSPRPTSIGPLTSEQARFMVELRNRNVPVDEIASLMETMRRERGAAPEGGLHDGGGQTTHTAVEDAPPPSYDRATTAKDL